MSRTNRRGGKVSPIKKYLSFSGNTGEFSYYDKTKKENVVVDDLSIVLLDVRSSITGYNSTSKSSITSNMVADVSKEVFEVSSWKDGKKNVLVEGLYSDIKGKVKTVGGKFTANIIALADVGQGEEIVNIQFSGSSLNGWIEFRNGLKGAEYDSRIDIFKGSLSKVDGDGFTPVTPKEEKALMAKLKKNPRAKQPIWFYVLGFSTTDLTEEEVEAANEQDELLQSYFGEAKPIDSDFEEGDIPEDPEEGGKGDLPF